MKTMMQKIMMQKIMMQMKMTTKTTRKTMTKQIKNKMMKRIQTNNGIKMIKNHCEHSSAHGGFSFPLNTLIHFFDASGAPFQYVPCTHYHHVQYSNFQGVAQRALPEMPYNHSQI